MTKEDMMVYAEFMAGYDVNQTPMAGLGVGDLIPEEAWEVWSEGLIVQHDGREVCILPHKSKGELKVRTFTMDENGDLYDCDWIPTDEELIAELKKQDFCAPWVGPGEMKYIILRKWPDAFKS